MWVQVVFSGSFVPGVDAKSAGEAAAELAAVCLSHYRYISMNIHTHTPKYLCKTYCSMLGPPLARLHFHVYVTALDHT